ncbi:hypothetical protein N6H18_17395 [Reichenbachiella agarivorans]|uniref:Outer membrane protein beta-barrel domain-containing protein n=1 Tax=Reichenbachiella agarivorans TaxID=2979464 RepID=A0ABY6CNN2_9BACT|nr:hypothetical protein [Reichenbachiella agarivorans]UXP32120.1 hypothetical protein N6H18_17395 [Reichenbachiella agarivorans]
MKTLKTMLAITILTAITNNIFGQDLKLSVYSKPNRELSNMGTSIGLLLLGTIGDIEVGAFYEKNNQFNTQKVNTDINIQNSANYSGIYSTIYLLGTKNLVAGINMRAGMVNTDRVVITFAAVTEYYINHNISVGAAARFISKTPVIEAKLSLNLAGSKRRTQRQKKYAENKNFYRTLRTSRN